MPIWSCGQCSTGSLIKIAEADPPQGGLEQERKEIGGCVRVQKGLSLLGGDQHFSTTAQQARHLEHDAGDVNWQGIGFVQHPIDGKDLILGDILASRSVQRVLAYRPVTGHRLRSGASRLVRQPVQSPDGLP